MPQILNVIEGEQVLLHADGSITYSGPMMVDGDGTGSSHGDPDYQSTTSLRHDGKYLDADIDQYIVLPPQIIDSVGPIVLGCQADVLDTKNGVHCPAVVGDVGPHAKLGEASIATCRALGVDPSPTSGGEAAHIFLYTIYPGKPAEVNGKNYSLQPS